MKRESRTANPRSDGDGGGLAGLSLVVVEDEANRELGTVPFDMNEVRTRAEGLGGDPVRQMVKLVREALAAAHLSLSKSGHAVLERVLSKAALAEAWPPRISVEGVAVASPPTAQAGSSNGARDGFARRNWPTDLFEERLVFPEPNARARFAGLIGLDQQKDALIKEAVLLARPAQLAAWAKRHHHHDGKRLVEEFAQGAPLFVFAGDVGTGKTALAETFPDAIARTLSEPVHLFRLSLQTRGSGVVGQMSEQITKAFAFVEDEARATNTVTVLLLDEADSIAASRDTPQMHHEDRAGVNAVIQGVDRLREPDVPALVVFCTNRGDALDPAIRRRAMHYFQFVRPNAEQRESLLRDRLGGYSVTPEGLARLVTLTGSRSAGEPGFTYSDLTDRLLRTAVLRAYPDAALSAVLLCEVAEKMAPTPAFGRAIREVAS